MRTLPNAGGGAGASSVETGALGITDGSGRSVRVAG